MSIRGGIASVFVIISVTAIARPADLFVATNGSDSAAGTITAPFRTLAKAKATVRTLLTTGTDAINVYFAKARIISTQRSCFRRRTAAARRGP